jgi:HK97 family phage major capsid protein
MANVQEILELRKKRANLANQLKDVLDRAKEEKRELSADEEVQADRIIADEEELRKKIERLEKAEDMQRSLEGHENRFKAAGEENRQKTEYRDVFKKWITGGVEQLDAEERNLLFSNRASDPETRALSATTGAAGGYTVPVGFYDQLIEAQKWFGNLRQCCNVFSTDSGQQLQIPSTNDTGNLGAILAENAQASTGDVSFSQVTLGAYKYTSNIVLVPIELLQDSAFDIESFLARKLGERIGRIQNQHFTIGTGTGQPQGIVTGSSQGKVAANGQTTAVTYDDLVDLEHSVDPSYRYNPMTQFMFHDQTLKALKKLKDGYGRPLWVPGVALREPDTINNFKYTINNDVPVMAANAKSILFGDCSNFWIRDVKSVFLVRFNEKYMDAGQVGFVAFSRADSKLVNAGMNPIAYFQNSAT